MRAALFASCSVGLVSLVACSDEGMSPGGRDAGRRDSGFGGFDTGGVMPPTGDANVPNVDGGLPTPTTDTGQVPTGDADVPPGSDGATGEDGSVGPGEDGSVGPGEDGSIGPGEDGSVGPGEDGGTGRDGSAGGMDGSAGPDGGSPADGGTSRPDGGGTDAAPMCAPAATSCSSTPCCAGLSCVRTAIGDFCVDTGMDCSGDSEPCTAGCCAGLLCGPRGLCYTPTPPCADAFESCASLACCRGNTCFTGPTGQAICVPDTITCSMEREPCGSGCCEGLVCGAEGQCEQGSPMCAGTLQACAFTRCCAGLTCSLFTPGGAPLCIPEMSCVDEGGLCSASATCCPGLTCNGRRCVQVDPVCSTAFEPCGIAQPCCESLVCSAFGGNGLVCVPIQGGGP